MVNSVARAFSILRCFEHARSNPDDRYLGNQDIARRTRLPKATVSRLSQTLAALGYLEYSPTLEKYALGPAVLGPVSYTHLDVYKRQAKASGVAGACSGNVRARYSPATTAPGRAAAAWLASTSSKAG